MGVYPNDQKEGMTARYHNVEMGQDVVRGGSVMLLGAAIGGEAAAPDKINGDAGENEQISDPGSGGREIGEIDD
jgi:hypothetical protein